MTWSSSNTAVATIDEKGVITTIAVGTAKITAHSDAVMDDDDITVTVTEKGGDTPIGEVDVDILEDNMRLDVGASVTLTAVVKPTGADNRIVWMSSNPSIALVSNNGTVTAVAEGRAEITALNPASGEDDDIDIKVGNASPRPGEDDIEVEPEDVYLKPGETI